MVGFKSRNGLSDLVWVNEDGDHIGEVVWLMGLATGKDRVMVEMELYYKWRSYWRGGLVNGFGYWRCGLPDARCKGSPLQRLAREKRGITSRGSPLQWILHLCFLFVFFFPFSFFCVQLVISQVKLRFSSISQWRETQVAQVNLGTIIEPQVAPKNK